MKALVALLSILLSLPAWADTVGTSTAPPTPANSQTTISTAPTAPSSTSASQMQGLAGSITPSMTGTVLVTISGAVCIGTTNCQASGTGTAATTGLQYQISMGTGTAPANNAANTGTQYGVVQSHMNGAAMTAGDLFYPFSVSAVVTGLTIGTTYWIDLTAKSLGVASGQGFSQVSVTATELP